MTVRFIAFMLTETQSFLGSGPYSEFSNQHPENIYLAQTVQVTMSACAPAEEIRFSLTAPTRAAVNFRLSDKRAII